MSLRGVVARSQADEVRGVLAAALRAHQSFQTDLTDDEDYVWRVKQEKLMRDLFAAQQASAAKIAAENHQRAQRPPSPYVPGQGNAIQDQLRSNYYSLDIERLPMLVQNWTIRDFRRIAYDVLFAIERQQLFRKLPSVVTGRKPIALIDGANIIQGSATNLIQEKYAQIMRDAKRLSDAGYIIVVVWTYTAMFQKIMNADNEAAGRTMQTILQNFVTDQRTNGLGFLNSTDGMQSVYFVILKYNHRYLHKNDERKCFYNGVRRQKADHMYCEVDDIFLILLRNYMLEANKGRPVHVVSEEKKILDKTDAQVDSVVNAVDSLLETVEDLKIEVDLLEVRPSGAPDTNLRALDGLERLF